MKEGPKREEIQREKTFGPSTMMDYRLILPLTIIDRWIHLYHIIILLPATHNDSFGLYQAPRAYKGVPP
jgi:hypothetical protein